MSAWPTSCERPAKELAAGGSPSPTRSEHLTDPDSRIVIRDGGFVQAYNAPVAADESNQFVVTAALSNQGTSAQYLEPRLRRVIDNCDAVRALTTSDAGNFSADNVLAAEHLGARFQRVRS